MPEQTNLKRTDNRVKICAFGNSGRRDKLTSQTHKFPGGRCCFNFANSAQTNVLILSKLSMTIQYIVPNTAAQGSANFVFFAANNSNGGLSLAPLHRLIPENFPFR